MAIFTSLKPFKTLNTAIFYSLKPYGEPNMAVFTSLKPYGEQKTAVFAIFAPSSGFISFDSGLLLKFFVDLHQFFPSAEEFTKHNH